MRRGKRRSAELELALPIPVDSGAEEVQTIDIVAPDRFSTAMLMRFAAPLFPAEIVPGSYWTVRLPPPPAQGRWVLELLSLVERWLESAGLSSVNVLYGGRSYLIRAPELAATGTML
ncbi:MAG: hypothetical protein AABM30_08295 [Actinomycetota bacterium]